MGMSSTRSKPLYGRLLHRIASSRRNLLILSWEFSPGLSPALAWPLLKPNWSTFISESSRNHPQGAGWLRLPRSCVTSGNSLLGWQEETCARRCWLCPQRCSWFFSSLASTSPVCCSAVLLKDKGSWQFAALGSGRPRLIRQLLVESMLLAMLGTLAGVLFAVASVRYFNSANPVELPPGNPVTLNFHVLSFAALLAAVTGMFFGLMPAWRASLVDLNDVLKHSGGTATRSKNHRTSKLLVVGQVTLAMVLLSGAGLLIESIYRLGSVPLGFRPDHLLTAEVALPPIAYSEMSQRIVFYSKLNAALAALPGVTGVSLCSSLPPYNGGASSELAVSGKVTIENLGAVNSVDVGADYFRVLGVPLLQGREFDSRDREESQRVAIVNDRMARMYFPKEDPLGRQIKLGKSGGNGPWLTIVGVVGDEKRTIVYQEMGYIEPALVYLPVAQAAGRSMGLVIRIAGNPLVLAPLLQAEVSRVDSGVPVYGVRTMTDRYSEFLGHPRFRAFIMGIVAGLTLLLAVIGIYGVLAQSVVQRKREIGIRLTLGARSTDVFGLVLREGMKMTVVGVVVGLLGAFGLTRFMSAMLYGVSATDPLTLTVVSLVFTMVAFAACYIPARRTTRVDPMIVLRYE